jgi:hypothetical protein
LNGPLPPEKVKALNKVFDERSAENAHYNAKAKDAEAEDEYERLTRDSDEYDPEHEMGKAEFQSDFGRDESVSPRGARSIRESMDTSESAVRAQRKAKFNEMKRAIRELVDDEVDEVSTSAAAGPYMTPNAFAGKQKTRRKQIAQQLGYKLTPGWEKNENVVIEGRYQDFKAAPGKPSQKISRSISEMNKQLREIEDKLKMVHRLKTEINDPDSKLGKRANRALLAIEARLLSVANRIREMRS